VQNLLQKKLSLLLYRIYKPNKKGGFTMRKRLFLTVSVLAVGLGMLLANTADIFAQEAAIVKIWTKTEGETKGIRVDPPLLTIEKNTIVVWVNGVPDTEVQIVFEEGKTCRDVTANPNLKHPGFFLDSKGCYSTSFLPYTETSTLQFPQVGSFEYKVVTTDGAMSGKGIIAVKYKIKEE